jgi:uncharacterized protein (DUF486 family)
MIYSAKINLANLPLYVNVFPKIMSRTNTLAYSPHQFPLTIFSLYSLRSTFFSNHVRGGDQAAIFAHRHAHRLERLYDLRLVRPLEGLRAKPLLLLFCSAGAWPFLSIACKCRPTVGIPLLHARQLKVMQEVITMSVIALICVFYMGSGSRWTFCGPACAWPGGVLHVPRG